MTNADFVLAGILVVAAGVWAILSTYSAIQFGKKYLKEKGDNDA